MNKIFKSKRVIALTLLLSAITVCITMYSSFLDYKNEIETKKAILYDEAKNEKTLIQTLFQNGTQKDSILKLIKSKNLTISNHGNSGEFAIAELVGDSINFIFRRTFFDDIKEKKIYLKSGYATPMRMALNGFNGSVIDKDYRGVEVIAGITNIADLKWGIVAKIEISEIEEPYQKRIIFILIIALVLTFLCVLLFLKITNPLLKEIEKNANYLHTTIQSIGDGFITTDKVGYVINMNPVAEKMCGISLDKAKGKLLTEIFHIINSETRKIVENPVQKVIESGLIIGLANHTVLISKDGTKYQIADSAAPIKDSQGNISGVVLVFSDVTEKYKAEESLRQSEERFRILFDKAPLGYQSLDIDGNFIDVNQQWLDTLGYNKDEVLGKWFGDFLTPLYQNGFRERFPLFKKLGKIHSEFEMIHKNGSILFIAFDGKIGYNLEGGFKQTHCILRDITVQRKTERALTESEERMRLAIENSPVPIVIHDEDDNVILLSKGWTDFSGYTIEDIPKLGDWTEKAYGERRGAKKDYIDNLFKINKTEYNGEWIITAKDGSKRIWEFQTTPLGKVNDGKRVIHSMAIDITERKMAEQANIEANIRLDTAMLSGKIAWWEMELPSGYIKFSELKAQMIGYSADNFKHYSDFTKLLHPEDYDRVMQKMRDHINGLSDSYDVEYRIKNSKDEFFWFKDIGKITERDKDSDNIVLTGVVIDINELKKTEIELLKAKEKAEKSEDKYRSVVENINEAIIVDDYEGKTIFVNEEFCNIFGYSNEEAKNLSITDYTAPEWIDLIMHRHKNRMAGIEEVDVYEYEGVRKNGEKIWMETKVTLLKDGDKIIGTQSFERNITERKKSEIQLKESEESLKVILESINEGFLAIDNYGKVIKFNSQFGIMWKIPDHIIETGDDNQLINHILPQLKDSNEFLEKVKSLYDSDLSSIDIIRFIDGRVFERISNPLLIDSIIIGRVWCFRDITEKVRREQDLLEAKEKAEESDKLKTAFLQNMSHEIRTPLHGILGFSNLLQDDNIEKEDIKEFTTVIQQSGNRLLEIVNNVLDISKIETGQISISKNAFLINTVFSDLLTFFTPFAESKNIKLSYKNLDNTKRIIFSDESKLSQILTNLINNSLKFTTIGSIEYGYEIIDNDIQFYVKDTGIGISSQYYKKIFDRFTQVDLKITRGYEGAGLGLAICKGLVELLGGKIWLDSEVGLGTTFYFTIPLIEEKSELPFEKNETITPVNLREGKILIAEDDLTSFQYLSKLLAKTEVKIIHAENGANAIEFVKSMPDLNMVLMDIRMPVMNGIEATKIIKQLRPELPIIAQTAYAFSSEKEEILSIGCNDYLSKPISKPVLINLIEKYML